jgi:lysozyme family protein
MIDPKILSLIEKTLEFEGGYVNDELDPGGETNFGISKRAFPDFNIKSLTKEKAIEIYYEKYWLPVVEYSVLTNERFLWKLFDIAVNQGPGTAEAFHDKVEVNPFVDNMLHQLSTMQMKRYALIIKARPSQVKYLSGWVNRAMTI